MSTTEAVKSSKEYMTVPIVELVESSTNPRRVFDQSFLEELAESIRNRGILSPLLVRPVNNHLEIVAGAQRYRAAKLAGLEVAPIRLKAMTDLEAQEAQQIENVQRKDVHPFEEAQGFRALLGFEGANYTIEKIAARIGKRPECVAERLKLLDLIEPVANAFVAGHIGLAHALLIAKLGADVQENALAHCFDGYYAANNTERSLVPASRLQAWIAQNVYLSLKSVPFSKEDETLLPEAGSCANCPKRTGFNTLLFSEVKDDSCSDAGCFNRKLDAHITQRMEKMPNLVLISEKFTIEGETPIIPRRNYVEVVTRKAKKGNEARPEQRLCDHLKPAIYADGMEKGRLVKVCAERSCKVHFREQQQQEKQRLQFKAEKKAANRTMKRTISFRHRLMADVLKRVKPQFGTEEMRMVACFALRSLPHELACRLAKRHDLQNPKDPRDYQMAEKARTLYKKADAFGLAVLIYEAMLLDSAERTTESKEDDPLSTAASLFKIDTKALRASIAKEELEKARKKAKKTTSKEKPKPAAKSAHK
ncbi:MAG: ParB/RepB/Spo0J family partition protein [Candidatus Acidiferrales bacterium]